MIGQWTCQQSFPRGVRVWSGELVREVWRNLVGVVASVPSVAPGLEGTASVPLVNFSALELSALPFPQFTGSESTSMSVLRRLACTDQFQHARLRASARLSDGSLTDVTDVVSTSALTPDLLTVALPGDNPLISRTQWQLYPQAVGSADMQPWNEDTRNRRSCRDPLTKMEMLELRHE